MADHLKNLLHLLDKAGMEYRLRKFDVAEMTRAFRHGLGAGFAPVLSVNGAEERVVQSTVTRLHARLVHGLWGDDVAHAHVLDLFRRQNAELYLLNSLERRARVGEVDVRHLCG